MTLSPSGKIPAGVSIFAIYRINGSKNNHGEKQILADLLMKKFF